MKEAEISKSEKYVTMALFERSMAKIANSFADLETKIDARFSKTESILGKIIQQLDLIQTERKEHRLELVSLNHAVVQHERSIDDLQDRVGLIEESN